MEIFPRQKIKEILRGKVVKCYQIRNNHQDDNWVNKKIFKNTLDPFSAVLDAKIMYLSIDECIKNVELTRQKQKSLQHEIGNIHQEILGSLDGESFYELATGNKNALRILFNEFPILIEES